MRLHFDVSGHKQVIGLIWVITMTGSFDVRPFATRTQSY